MAELLIELKPSSRCWQRAGSTKKIRSEDVGRTGGRRGSRLCQVFDAQSRAVLMMTDKGAFSLFPDSSVASFRVFELSTAESPRSGRDYILKCLRLRW